MNKNRRLTIIDVDYLKSVLEPKFVKRGNCIFFKGHFTDRNYNRYWKKHAVINREKIECTINHIHISDLTRNLTFQQELAKIIAKVWRLNLKEQFPRRKFKIIIRKLHKELILDLSTEKKN